ncbi:MAG: hypothetical protein IJ761_05060 [Bacteroidales bacterium]|nr:hypothetical protein [Bacteroidales bacterium]
MKHTKTLVFAVLLLLGTGVKAQYAPANNLEYHSFRNPNANDLNPAFFPIRNSIFVRLPQMGFEMGMPFAISDVLHYDRETQTTVLNFNDMLNALHADNDIRSAFDVEVLGAGAKFGSLFVTFNTRLHADFNLGLPVQSLTTLEQGNYNDDGSSNNELVVLDGDLLSTQAYAEVALGAAYKLPMIDLTVGARAKLLYGMFNMQTANSRVSLTTSDNADTLTARINYQLQQAGAVQYDTSAHEMIFNRNELFDLSHANSGLAFDLGAKYKLGPFTFSFALNDISRGIHWQQNVNTITPRGGAATVQFTGIDISEMLVDGRVNTDTLTTLLNEKIDELQPQFTQNAGSYWSPIPTKIMIGASYSMGSLLRAGLLLHGQWDRGIFSIDESSSALGLPKIDNTFRFNTTASVGVNLSDWFEVIVGSSLVYDGEHIDLFNPGCSMIFSAFGAAQIYFTVDYVSSIFFTDFKAFHFKSGMNVMIGRGNKNKS